MLFRSDQMDGNVINIDLALLYEVEQEIKRPVTIAIAIIPGISGTLLFSREHG